MRRSLKAADWSSLASVVPLELLGGRVASLFLGSRITSDPLLLLVLVFFPVFLVSNAGSIAKGLEMAGEEPGPSAAPRAESPAARGRCARVRGVQTQRSLDTRGQRRVFRLFTVF